MSLVPNGNTASHTTALTWNSSSLTFLLYAQATLALFSLFFSSDQSLSSVRSLTLSFIKAAYYSAIRSFWNSTVTPTFYKDKKICANRGAYKNAYQIIVHMKNFPKINLVQDALHGMAYYIFLKSLRSLEEFRKNPHVKIPPKSPSTNFPSLGKFKIQFLFEKNSSSEFSPLGPAGPRASGAPPNRHLPHRKTPPAAPPSPSPHAG
jgi:hypothetical protein